MKYCVRKNDNCEESYSVTDKLKLPVLQHNDLVTSIIPDISLLVRVGMFM